MIASGQAEPPMTTRSSLGSSSSGFCSRYCSSISHTVGTAAVSAGLDYFVLELLVLGLVFIPLERLFILRPQKIFRAGWQTDLKHFFVSHAGVQVLSFATLIPAQAFFASTDLKAATEAFKANPKAKKRFEDYGLAPAYDHPDGTPVPPLV